MSPGYETIIQRAQEHRNLQALFAALPLLKELDAATLERISDEVELFSLPGGATLFKAGDEPDGVYLVVNGALDGLAALPGGGMHSVAQFGAGEIVGDMELIAGGRRSLGVMALRDTELARLPFRTIEELLQARPDLLWRLSATLVRRLQTLQSPAVVPGTAGRIIAVLPQGPAVAAAEFAEQLVKELRRHGTVELVLEGTAANQTSHWFHRIERSNDYVIYVADARPTSWTHLCLRQSDTQLLLTRSELAARPWPTLRGLVDIAHRPQTREMVLLDRGTATGASAWLAAEPCRRHHHVRHSGDVARLARLLAGRAIGLVLSGGGARGFAHLGVLRALREAGVPVDSIGGTSIGAIIAAGHAMGWDYQELGQRMYRSFVEASPLNDYTLPLLSLVSGRKVGALLRREFGQTAIEDLPTPFFCVAANLTSGQVAVCREGQLWLWLRASIAIPGVLPPVFAQRQVFVDGGTMNNLPVNVMRESIRGRVIGVDVGADRAFETAVELTEMPPPWSLTGWIRMRRTGVNIMQVLWRSGMINSATTTAGHRALADLLLKPPLDQVDMLDWRAYHRAVEIGYRHTVARLESGSLGNSDSSVA